MTLQEKKIGFVGNGRMGEALVRGILRAGIVAPKNIYSSDIDEQKLQILHEELGINISLDNKEIVQKSDIVILAVKPQVLKKVLQELRPHVMPKHLVISTAAGIPIQRVAGELPEDIRVVRVMPNIAATVEAAPSAVCYGPAVTKEDMGIVEEIFGAVGRVVRVPEHLMDAVTGLSGSGPAYVFVMIEALADGGVYEGLDRNTSLILAAQTVFGAAKMVLETGKHPAELKDMVASPGGTTIQGLRVLEEKGFRAALISAVSAATTRSKELGETGWNNPLERSDSGAKE